MILVGMPIVPSPLRSWWKLGSYDCSTELEPDTTPLGLASMLPPLSLVHPLYCSAPIFHPLTSPPSPYTTPFRSKGPNCPTVTGAPLYLIGGPDEPPVGNRK